MEYSFTARKKRSLGSLPNAKIYMCSASSINREPGHSKVPSLQRRYWGCERSFAGKISQYSSLTSLMVDQLWVFNPDLVYSTSIQPRGPQRAMKIFYQNILEPSHQLEKNFMVMDEFRLSGQALQTLREDLKVSGSFLPLPARNYQNWNVGLLQR